MSRRSVQDVMTARVVTVAEDTPFKKVAAVMAGRHVGALPVLGPGGRVAGLVREAGLLAKEEVKDDPAAPRLPWWRRRRARVQARGLTAGDLMISPAPQIGAGASVVQAARVMDRCGCGHLVVTTPHGELAGIISRRDVVRVFLRPDTDIRAEIMRDVFVGYLGTNPALVRVSVADGVVTLAGEVETRSMIPAAIRMARSVDGVVAVDAGLTFAVDDTRLPPSPDLARR
jgi:CBS domain-containing protein